MKNINKPTNSIQIPIVEKSNERTNLIVRVISAKNIYNGGAGATLQSHTIPPDEHSR